GAQRAGRRAAALSRRGGGRQEVATCSKTDLRKPWLAGIGFRGIESCIGCCCAFIRGRIASDLPRAWSKHSTICVTSEPSRARVWRVWCCGYLPKQRLESSENKRGGSCCKKLAAG